MRLIPLNGKHGVGKFAMVDDEDFERVSQYKWYVDKDNYVKRNVRIDDIKTTLLLHRVILNITDHRIIDHKNRNPLDNRKENLRVCSHVENACNAKKRNNATSVYKGVHANTHKGMAPFVVNLDVGRQRVYTDYFHTEEDAAKAYDFHALKYHGDFAVLNFPDFDYSNYKPKPAKLRFKSKYLGVSINVKCRVDGSGQWRARLVVEGKDIVIGYYDTELEAAKAYNKYVMDNSLNKKLNRFEEGAGAE